MIQILLPGGRVNQRQYLYLYLADLKREESTCHEVIAGCVVEELTVMNDLGSRKNLREVPGVTFITGFPINSEHLYALLVLWIEQGI